MSRKRKDITLQPWLSAQLDCREKSYVMEGGTLREAKAWQALTLNARNTYSCIKDAIKANMGGSDVLLAGEYKITWKAVESRRLDTAALSKALPELAAQFTKTTTVRRFCIA